MDGPHIGPIDAQGNPAEPFPAQARILGVGYVDAQGKRIPKAQTRGSIVNLALTGGTGSGKTGALVPLAWHSCRFNPRHNDARIILAGPTYADLKRNLLGPFLARLPMHPNDNGADPMTRLNANTLSPAILEVDQHQQRTMWLRPGWGGVVTWETSGKASRNAERKDAGQGISASALFITEAQAMPEGALQRLIDRVRTPAPYMRIMLEGIPESSWFTDVWCPAKDVTWIRLDTRENPHLSPDYVRNITRGMTPQQAEYWLAGIPIPKSGQVISGYQPNWADAEDQVPAPDGSLTEQPVRALSPSALLVDFGRNSPAWILVQPKREEGRHTNRCDWRREAWVAVHEWTFNGISTEAQALAIRADLDRFGCLQTLEWIAGDPAGDAATSKSDSTDVDALRKVFAGIQFKRPQPGNRLITPGCKRLDAVFLNAHGDRRFYVAAHLARRDYLQQLSRTGRKGLHGSLVGYGWQLDRDGRKIDQPYKDGIHDHFCFPAGTLVQAERGAVPIERLRNGERVWTREGLRRVVATGSNGVQLLREVHHTGGAFRATGDHPVWVAGKGFVAVDGLRYGDIIIEWNQQAERPSRFAASDTIATPTPTTPRTRGISEVIQRRGTPATCTAISGSITTGPSPTASTSTTSTRTRATTSLRTWSASAAQSIFRSICASALTILSTGKSSLQHWAKSARLLPIGTGQSKAGLGTASMPSGFGQQACRRRNFFAGIAGSSSRPATPTAPSGAATTARQQLGGQAASITLSASVGIAAQRSSQTSTARPETVQRRVLHVVASPSECVYNLTVEGEHEYFADGVLVSNCDAARYGTMAIRPKEAPPPVPPKLPTQPKRSDLSRRLDKALRF